MFILRNWSITGMLDPKKHKIYKGSILNRLTGRIFNNPKFENGKEVVTSVISKIDGRKITTIKGSIYILFGPPSEHFISFLDGYNLKFNEENPISFNMLEKHEREINNDRTRKQ